MEKLIDWDLDHVIAAIEENRYDLLTYSAKYVAGKVYHEEGFSWVNSPSTWPSCVFRLVPTDNNIQHLKEQINCGTIPGFITIGESLMVNSLLEKYGFIKKWSTAGMAADMNEVDSWISQVDGLIKETVEDEETLSEWLKIVSTALFRSENSKIDAYAGLMRNNEAIFYLGRLNGKPVATSAVFFARGVAGIYWVSTLEDYRSMGIGSTMTAITMMEAVSQGYRIAILQASEMGESVYKKLGFERLSTIGNYTLG